MRLLHGSNVEIVQPDLVKCQSKNDFGRGFYLTPQWQRAYMMGKRRGKQRWWRNRGLTFPLLSCQGARA